MCPLHGVCLSACPSVCLYVYVDVCADVSYNEAYFYNPQFLLKKRKKKNESGTKMEHQPPTHLPLSLLHSLSKHTHTAHVFHFLFIVFFFFFASFGVFHSSSPSPLSYRIVTGDRYRIARHPRARESYAYSWSCPVRWDEMEKGGPSWLSGSSLSFTLSMHNLYLLALVYMQSSSSLRL